ncbi:MAG: carboxypeptidase regulatory-like domain-containing protein, partial [Acidobacteria bacterium]|nr:carboxypeptidase regulatory-like domain-containing protein [Acidobacteriota bacterium]
MKYFIKATALLVVLLFSQLIASAQVTTARLEGLVRDPSGAVVPGVTVVATHDGTNLSTEVLSNEIGLYVFPRLST